MKILAMCQICGRTGTVEEIAKCEGLGEPLQKYEIGQEVRLNYLAFPVAVIVDTNVRPHANKWRLKPIHIRWYRVRDKKGNYKWVGAKLVLGLA